MLHNRIFIVDCRWWAVSLDVPTQIEKSGSGGCTMITEIQCAMCENTSDVKSCAFKMDIKANLICKSCVDKAIKIKAGLCLDGRHYYHAEYRLEEFTTGYFKQRGQAEQRCIDIIRALQSANVWDSSLAIIEE
jgi:hypothetical protein